MKSKEEKEYYNYLEKIIREQKASSPFFEKGSESYKMDIFMLFEHIQEKNPFLMDSILENFIDTTGLENASKADILAFMSKTDKGTICRWKNEEGEEVYLINNGRNLMKNTKRILVLGSHLTKNDMELFQKTMYGAILKKDIEYVYKKIEQDNLNKMQKRKSVADFINVRKEKSLDVSFTSFEKNFKELVRKQGTACSPLVIAQTITAFMPGLEKKKLLKSFSNIGIKSLSSYERLLTNWKNEALHPEYEITRHKQKSKKEINIEIYRGR